MTSPSPAPRRLTRSTRDRYLAGVCGGLAEYLNVDATLVRLAAIILTVSGFGFPVALYIVALFVVPEGDQAQPPAGPHPPVHPPSGAPGPYPPAPPHGPGDPVWGSEGAPWEQPQPGSGKPDPEAPQDRS